MKLMHHGAKHEPAQKMRLPESSTSKNEMQEREIETGQ